MLNPTYICTIILSQLRNFFPSDEPTLHYFIAYGILPTMNPTPQGKLTIQTIAMPKDANANGDIFGGWLVSQMDLGAAIMAYERARGRVTTVAIDSMVFHKPVNVGDVVSCYADIKKVGNTSMTIHIEVWAIDRSTGERRHVTEGVFTFVAIDDNGKPRPVDS